MCVYKLNPLQDPRWQNLVDRHPHGSVFHTVYWLEALRRTYRYEPVVYTTTPPGKELSNGIVFCHIRSWLSGGRLVSLPFSDHCEPLAGAEEMAELMDWLKASRHRKQWKYIELRPLSPDGAARACNLTKSESFSLQMLDLRPSMDTLFHNFHKSCVQRKIHRAERENLTYEEGRSDALLKKFYDLLLLTRRRHGLPPQPLVWFRTAVACLGGRILIRIASKDGQPVASIVTIQYKDVLVYKYGCSDCRFNKLGGNSLLFWKAIQDAKRNGALKYDLGRSEPDNSGLVSFKENWGAASVPLDYYRVPAQQPFRLNSAWRTRVAKGVFSMMPDALLAATGRLLYRHIG
ncbi:MAG TPA: GNAT family N-acetyltransferase [Candidatus Acidoferrum sp.]|nr:GNAT family N-acetyltransferase [Candidatus Acidoferrum sp.]